MTRVLIAELQLVKVPFEVGILHHRESLGGRDVNLQIAKAIELTMRRVRRREAVTSYRVVRQMHSLEYR